MRICAIPLAMAVLILGGACSSNDDATQPSDAARSSSHSSPPPAEHAPTSADLLPGSGNEDLAVGETRLARVNLHCGLHYARFDGLDWKTRSVGNGSSPFSSGVIEGLATRTAADTVTFKSSRSARTITFRPASSPGVCF